MPRKKRIAILVTVAILIILIIIGILGYLYLKTDVFKTKEMLFAKYLTQNFEKISILENESEEEIKTQLDNNKYTSQIIGTLEYTENESNINNVKIKVDSNIDNINNYDYKDISIEDENNKLLGFEYLKQDETYGIRLNDIQQFVSIEKNKENNNTDETKIYTIEELTSKIDTNSIFNFAEEEKQELANTYLKIIKSNITSDKYYKQPNALITVNNKSIQTNAYYIKLTIEEYNNLIIKMLEQIKKDEIILSRIDLIEDEIKQKYSEYQQEESLRTKFVNYISKKIETIQNNNIGNEEVRVIVYENNMKTVRTAIEKSTEKINIDMYNENSIKIDKNILTDNTKEQILKIEKANNNTLIEYEELQDNETLKDIQVNYQQEIGNYNIIKNLELSVSNGEYKGTLTIEDNIEIVDEFENQITLETDNIKLDDLQQTQRDLIKQILNENYKSQLSSLNSIVTLEDYKTMLENLGLIQKSSIEIPDNGEVTDIERKRFNSQFDFFATENLTYENIVQLVETAKNNFEDMRILTKDNSIEELDEDKLNSQQESKDYKENISELLIYIKQNSTNSERQEQILNYLENNKDNKYDVSINYDEDGLARIIRIKIQK